MIRLVLLAAIAGIAVYLVVRWRRERRQDELARIRAAFLLPRPERVSTRREAPRLRPVTLADGQLQIRIPEAWEEERMAGAFCARASALRRLRVELRTLEGKGMSLARLADALRESPAGKTGFVEILSGDRVLLKHVRSGSGEGGARVTYCWELATPRPHDRAVLAEFHFNVPLESVDAITEDDVWLLEREIRDARFSRPPDVH